MPTPTKGPRLGGGPAHERLILSNLAASLFTYGRIETTEAKAKRLKPFAERLITFGKRGDLHARRRALSILKDKTVVHVLFTEIAPQVEGRDGGYTRIIKTGYRKGDNAPMAVIELVLEPVVKKTPTKAKVEKPTAEETVVEETVAEEPVVEDTAEAEAGDSEGADVEEAPAAEDAEAAEKTEDAK